MSLTTPQLRALVEPFVRARFRRDLSRAIDISCPRLGVCKCNADVRSISEEGVETYFNGRCEVLPWDQIASVEIRTMDAEGFQTGAKKYTHTGAIRWAA